MDEPFGVPTQNRFLLQDELLYIWDQTDIMAGARKTILFVTHSIDEALVLGDRALNATAAPGRIKRRYAPLPAALHARTGATPFRRVELPIWEAQR